MANDAKLNAVVTLSDRFSKPLAEMNKKLRGFQAPMQKFSNQLRQLDRSSGFNKVRAGIGGVGKQMAYLGVAAAGVVASLGYMTGRVAKSGDAYAKSARAIGISGEALQEWTYVAERFGVEQSGLNTSLQQFSKRMGELKAGTGSMVTLLDKMNPELIEQLSTTESLDEALELYLDAIRSIDDPTRQAALATAAFGRSGLGMTNIARGSKEEIQGLKDEIRALGGIMSEEALANAEAYQDSMTKFSGVMNGFQIVLGAKLMPKITALMERFAAWYLANKELIDQKLNVYIEKLSDSFTRFVEWVEESGPGIAKFIDKIGGFKTVALGIAGVIAGPLLLAFATLAKALLFTPIGIALTATAAGIYVLVTAAKALKDNWGSIMQWFSDSWQSISETVAELWETIQKILNTKVVNIFGNDSAPANSSERGPQNMDEDVSPLALASKQGGQKRDRTLTRKSENQSTEVNINITKEGQVKVGKVTSSSRDLITNTNVGMSGVGG